MYCKLKSPLLKKESVVCKHTQRNTIKRNLIVGLKYYFYLEQIVKVQQSLDGEYFEINIRPIT